MQIGIIEIIQIIFIALKIAGVITWPWAVVFIPLYIDIVLILGVWIGCAATVREVRKKDFWK